MYLYHRYPFIHGLWHIYIQMLFSIFGYTIQFNFNLYWYRLNSGNSTTDVVDDGNFCWATSQLCRRDFSEEMDFSSENSWSKFTIKKSQHANWFHLDETKSSVSVEETKNLNTNQYKKEKKKNPFWNRNDS